LAGFQVTTIGRIWVTAEAGELIEGKSLADDALDGHVEALSISQFAIVEAIDLLIEITEKMERFHAHVGSIDPAF
jgi:hypothetical protein